VRHQLLACALLLSGTLQVRAQDPDKQSFEMIEHGRYMAAAADCAACHTAPGGRPYAGGGALETPFGVLLSPNITPDQQTGIGGWTDEEFVQAVQNGIGHGGIHLYPAMPYVYYAKLTRADVLAIRAYLDALQPVHNRVITNQLPFPFNQRESMAAWNALYFQAWPVQA
jgi:mono/diheme cytochrome c family protein